MPQNSNVSFFQDLTNQEGEPPACFPLNVTGAENIFSRSFAKFVGSSSVGPPERQPQIPDPCPFGCICTCMLPPGEVRMERLGTPDHIVTSSEI